MNKLKLYNSITRRLEEFKPINDRDVKIYICGPTVYDSPHVGHARTYVSFDVIRRVLKNYFNYGVTLTMNITNIDDKIIKRANEMNIDYKDLTNKYENEFFLEMEKLNVLKPDFITRVDDYVEEIKKFIEKLEDDGFAYLADDKSVYFDINKFKEADFNYFVLRPETKKNTVVLEGEKESSVKRNENDFVLWKHSKKGEPEYESKWGMGRPGWHIECSVMASEIFGPKLDIHAGGVDLAFPHHENEIAQCVAYFKDSNWTNYFLHTGHLNIDGRKMAKSLKNFFTISEILEKVSSTVLRFFFIQHSWDGPMNYDVGQFERAEVTLNKFNTFFSNIDAIILSNSLLKTVSINGNDKLMYQKYINLKQNVHTALCNNINTPKVIELLNSFVSEVNKEINALNTDILRLIINYIKDMLNLFGIYKEENKSESLVEEKLALVLNDYRNDIRRLVKSNSDKKEYFILSDNLRNKVSELGYIIEDTGSKSIIRKK
ncbi:SYC [Hepatospora eriocheir]|uniref:cysteine--tRNA ligase n=1 Tax=Hepatospora eriocheir TaxID=1081669 RepID=A0A1X0QDH2_9MICR|nr:SYC [Hepatospora eriocheir]